MDFLHFWDIPKSESKLNFLGNDAAEKLIKSYSFSNVLDIGTGAGKAAEYFKSYNKFVTTLDRGDYHKYKPDLSGDFMDLEIERKFDLTWVSHVLEHIPNIQNFLKKISDVTKDNGIICITVPPLKHNVVSGHINLFNSLTLIYNVIISGIDCSDAILKAYGYNISLIVLNKKIKSDLVPFDIVHKYFPIKIHQNIDGRINNINWK